MTINIYLKNKKKPISFDISNSMENKFEQLYTDLLTKDIIKFGPVIFSRDDFTYADIQK